MTENPLSFRNFFANKSERRILDFVNSISDASTRFEKHVQRMFLLKNSATETLQLIYTAINFLKTHGNLECNSELANYLYNLVIEMSEATEAAKLCSQTAWEGQLKSVSINAIFTKIYKLYYDIIFTCHLIDKSFVYNVLYFIAQYCSDMDAIKPLVDNTKLPNAYLEIESHYRRLQKSLDISSLTVTKIERVSAEKLIISVTEKPKNENLSLEIFPPGASDAPFQHKNSIVSHIEHPSIIKYRSALHYAPYGILSESTDFPSLTEYLYSGQTLSPDIYSIIILEVARAFQYMHAHRFVHCRFTPDCILVRPNGLPLITGLDYVQRTSSKLSVSIPFCVYSAPETIYEPIFFNEKVDVYSFTIILHEILTNKKPFSEVDSYSLRQRIMLQDRRPLVPNQLPLTKILYKGWSRNPNYRPSFDDLVNMMVKNEFIIPGTNLEIFNSHIESTAEVNNSALKGLLSLTPQSLRDMSRGELDEYCIEIIVNVLLESNDEALVKSALEVYNQQILTKEQFTISELVTLVQLSRKISSVEDLVNSQYSKLDDKESFIKLLCERLPGDLSIPFFIKNLLTSEKNAEFILSFCANKPDNIAKSVADAVAIKFRESDILYKCAMMNNIYYRRVFELINDLEPDLVKKYFKYFSDFFAATPISFAPVMSNIYLKLGPSTIAEIDDNGVITNRLVKHNFASTVLALMTEIKFTKIVITYVIPMHYDKKPLETLRMIAEADKIAPLRDMLYKFDVLTVIYNCINQGHYEYTGAVILGLHIPKGKFLERMDIPNVVLNLFSVVEDVFSVSSLLSILIPFAEVGFEDMHLVPDVVCRLIKSNETVIAARALLISCVLSESRRYAKAIYNPDTVSAILRFANCGDPNFEYLSIRMICTLAPFITDNDDVPELIDVLSKRCKDEPITEIIFSIFSRMESKYRLNAAEVLAPIAQKYSGNNKIKELLKVIKNDGSQ